MASSLTVWPTNVQELLTRPYGITATLAIPRGGADGVVVCCGNRVGGYCLFLQDRYAYFVHNYVGLLELRVTSCEPVPDGRVTVQFAFEPPGPPDVETGKCTPGVGRLFFDDRLVGTQRFPVSIPLAFPVGAGFTIGRNPGSSVSTLYEPPFAFTGLILSAVADGAPWLTTRATLARRRRQTTDDSSSYAPDALCGSEH